MPPSARRDDRRLVAALVLLTLLTGLIDAASVLGLGHVFTANMTGNIVFFGFSLAGAGRVRTVDCALALAAFLGGAACGGRLGHAGVRFWVAVSFEAALLAAAAVVAFALDATVVEIALLAFAMGVQNASVRRLGVADLTTTVLTLTLTGLAAESLLAGGKSPGLGRRLISVAVMLLGAAAGALVLKRGLPWTIALAALVASVAGVVASFATPPAEPADHAATKA